MNKTSNPRLNQIKPNKENIRLIYLNNSEINSDIKSNLLKLNPASQFYTNIKLCIDTIKILFNEKLFLIISSTLLSKLFKILHSFKSIIAIFVYDDITNINELTINHPKIIGKYINQQNLYQSIEKYIQLIEQQVFIYNLFDEKFHSEEFYWHNLLIDVFKRLPQNEYLRNDILNKCSEYYRPNTYEFEQIELFRQNYTGQKTTQWYNSKSFLYKLLNRALNTNDFDILYSISFFLTDLSVEIENEYKRIKDEKFLTVYRAQIMTKDEIDILKNSINYFILINNFLFASKNKDKTLLTIKEKFSIYENILFEIHIDLSIEQISLADLPTDQNILFNINSLFRIDSIEHDLSTNLWNIKITSIKNCINYLNSVENKIDYHNSLIYFGYLLSNKYAQIDQAKNYFGILLNSLTNNDIDISEIYIQLAHINVKIEQFNIALQYYQYALNIYQKKVIKDDMKIAIILNYIGITQQHMKNFEQAIDHYEKSIDIFKSLSLQNEDLIYQTNTMINLALVYRDKKEYEISLNYLIQVDHNRRNILPKDHPLIVDSLITTADLYRDKKDFHEALNYYKQALSIQEKIYSYNDSNKINTMRNIGLIYQEKRDWENALNYLTRTLEIRKNLFYNNSNYNDLIISYEDIANLYEKMLKFDLAFAYYLKQLEIEEQYLQIDDVNLMKHFDRLICLLKKQNQLDKALELCEEKLSTLKIILGNENESNLQIGRILILIASIYEDKSPSEAHQYYQNALEIFEKNKNEDTFQICLSTMISFYWKCRMFDRALICQMKLLHVKRSSTPNNQDIAYNLRDLARLYRAMNKTNEALQNFEQCLNILKAKHGPDHVDVKNVEKEILGLKEMMKSLSVDADEDYNNRRCSYAYRDFIPKSQDDLIAQSSTFNCDARKRSTASNLTSAFCIII